MFKEVGKMLGDLQIENTKLKTCLTEIKEIVYLLNDRTMVRKDICDRLDLILQKISEVGNG